MLLWQADNDPPGRCASFPQPQLLPRPRKKNFKNYTLIYKIDNRSEGAIPSERLVGWAESGSVGSGSESTR